MLVAQCRWVGFIDGYPVVEDRPARFKRLVDYDTLGQCLLKALARLVLDFQCSVIPTAQMQPVVVVCFEFGGQAGERDRDLHGLFVIKFKEIGIVSELV